MALLGRLAIVHESDLTTGIRDHWPFLPTRFHDATIAQKVTGAPTSAQLATLAPYRIDDIEYGGQWDFANKGSLRASLVAALASPP